MVVFYRDKQEEAEDTNMEKSGQGKLVYVVLLKLRKCIKKPAAHDDLEW
jgi:hypothetical protein